MTGETHEYYCTGCHRRHRRWSLIGKAHSFFEETPTEAQRRRGDANARLIAMQSGTFRAGE